MMDSTLHLSFCTGWLPPIRFTSFLSSLPFRRNISPLFRSRTGLLHPQASLSPNLPSQQQQQQFPELQQEKPTTTSANCRIRCFLAALALLFLTAPGRVVALNILSDLVVRPLAVRHPVFAGGALGSEVLDVVLTATDQDPASVSNWESLRHGVEFVLHVAVNILLVCTF